jgi:hypothetical protein
MDLKIHEYPIERLVFGDDDYYDIDFWDGVEYKTAKILGSVIKAGILSGVAISLTAPSAFIVGGSPVDGTGTLTLTAAGLANQYIRGDGTLATFPTSSGGGNSVNYYLNGGTASSVATYFQMSKVAVIGTGVDFSRDGNGLISQWLTDLNEPNVTEIPAGNWNFEMYFSASSAGGVPKFYIEILKYNGTTFTTIANNSAVPESITGGTTIDLYLTSVPVPLTPLLVTDRIAIRVYIVDSTAGRTIIHHTQNSHLCQIITSFSSGISSINGLTKQTQYLAVGTAGSDFAINSATDTHTFNLPTASASRRGALSSADWTIFNNKQDLLVSTTNIKTINGTSILGSGNLVVGGGLTIGTTPITSGAVGRVLFEGAGNVAQEDSTFFWDNTNKRLGIGAIPNTSTRLDIRLQGALSTDIGFRVRNSADTTNLFEIRGDGNISLFPPSTFDIMKIFGSGGLTIAQFQNDGFGSIALGSGATFVGSTYGNVALGHSASTTNGYALAIGYGSKGHANYAIAIGYNAQCIGASAIKLGSHSGLSQFGGANSIYIGNSVSGNNITPDNVFMTYFASQSASTLTRSNGSFGLLGQTAYIMQNGTGIYGTDTFMGNGGNTLIIANHASIPSTNIANSFQQYSADIVAGNAVPHFRTENGNIIKLYKQDLPTNPTNAQIATFLSNLGLANLI